MRARAHRVRLCLPRAGLSSGPPVPRKASDLLVFQQGFSCGGHLNGKEDVMALLRWALIFAVVAIIVAVFGFTDIAGGAAEIARVLFFLFLAAVVVFVILGLLAFRSVSPG